MIGSKDAMAVGFFVTIASLAWSATIAWVYWLKHRFDTPGSPKLDAFTDDRVARVEAAVDALNIEIERIGETQRFALRVLEERLPATSRATHLPEGGRVTTPH